jgi:hypothetical protein
MPKISRGTDDKPEHVGDDFLKPISFYIRKLYERENEQIIDLAKLGVYTVHELEEMQIGNFYSYLAKELRDIEKIRPKNKKGKK